MTRRPTIETGVEIPDVAPCAPRAPLRGISTTTTNAAAPTLPGNGPSACALPRGGTDGLSLPAAARLIGLSPDSLKARLSDMIVLEDFPHPYIGCIHGGGRHMRFSPKAITDWMARRSRPDQSPIIYLQQRKIADRIADLRARTG